MLKKWIIIENMESATKGYKFINVYGSSRSNRGNPAVTTESLGTSTTSLTTSTSATFGLPATTPPSDISAGTTSSTTITAKSVATLATTTTTSAIESVKSVSITSTEASASSEVTSLKFTGSGPDSGSGNDTRSLDGGIRNLIGFNVSSVQNHTNEMLYFLSESLEINLNETNSNFNYSRTNLTLLNGAETYFNSGFTNLTSHGSTDHIPWWESVPYPQSGYSQLSIICLAFLITVVMILIVIGNLLVCIAIATEKSLKTIQNWFITSLAVSDLLLGLVIVPFSLAHELMGYWIFGTIWCDVHHALDVLLTTASINNLCLISLDRYWSVTQAVEYLKKRTPKRAMYMIVFVWVFSALVSLPPLVGWKNEDLKEGECELSEDIGYVFYSAFGSFYIPAVVMVFVYAKIFVAARSRARRHVKKKQVHVPEVTNDPTNNKSTTTTTCTSLSNPSPPDFNKEESCADSLNIERSSTPNTPNAPAPPKVTFCFDNAAEKGGHKPSEEKRPDSSAASPTTLSPPEIVIETSESPQPSPKLTAKQHHGQLPLSPSVNEKCDDLSGKQLRLQQLPNPSMSEEKSSMKTSPTRRLLPRLTVSINECASVAPEPKPVSGPCPSPSILKQQNGSATTNETRFTSSVDEDSDTVDSPVTKSGSTLAPHSYLSAPRLSKSPYGSCLSIADFDDSELGGDTGSESGSQKKKKKKGGHVKYDTPTNTSGRYTPSDAERHKRKVAKARERRATLILGLIMGSFIAAWVPFFIMYLVQAMCKSCNVGTYLKIGYWLGYSNSAVNPIIYTVFNRDFRKAFRKILFR